jgi:hypothetical protein
MTLRLAAARISLVSIALAIAFVSAGCNADHVTSPPSRSALEAAVARLGFSTEGMIEEGNFVVVEGDIALPKALLERTLSASTNLQLDSAHISIPGQPRQQWIANTHVSNANVSNVTVDVSQITDPDWAAAVRSAMSNWNALPGTLIHFSEDSPANITVTFANLNNSSTVARADYPSGSPGQPGASIQINTGHSGSISPGEMLTAMAHELGHTIGFRHTNWQSNTCGPETAGTLGANQVAGTPQSDAGSIMNCIASSWVGFSHYDSVAAMVYFYANVVETNSDGYPLVTVTYPRGATGVSLAIEHSHTEWYDYLQAYQTTYTEEFVGSPYSGTGTAVGYPWGHTYCSDWADYPYPQDQADYKLSIDYPQATVVMAGGAPAHVLGAGYEFYDCSG